MDILTADLREGTGRPLYLQLYAYIREEIRAGRIRPEEKLPSKRRLAAHLQISVNTVQGAYEQLVAEGYVFPREKRGYFVCPLEELARLEAPLAVGGAGFRPAPQLRFDFSHHGVDRAHFPFAQWRRLMKDVIDENDPDLLRVVDNQGLPALRESIAGYLHQSRGVICSPEQVVISSGTEALLQLLVQLFDAGRCYALENPGYERLNQLFQSNRVGFLPVGLDGQGMLPEVLEAGGADTAIVTPSHQFPTGTIMPIRRRIQLLNWAGRRPGRYIVEDDYDSEFKYSGKSIPALQGLDSGRVIYLGAFSKSLTPSIRISYMVLPPALLGDYRERLSFAVCPVPTAEQKALDRFIRDGSFARHLNRMRVIYRRKRDVLSEAIGRLLPGAEVLGANVGLHLALRPNCGLDEEELVAAAARAGVGVYGFSRYYSGPGYDPSHPQLLLGYATLEEQEIRQAVSLLAGAWPPASPS